MKMNTLVKVGVCRNQLSYPFGKRQTTVDLRQGLIKLREISNEFDPRLIRALNIG